jgi:transcriptional regulator with XRE-family HTH domain
MLKKDLQNLSCRIENLCNSKNMSVRAMLKECGLNKNAVDNIKNGSSPAIEKITIIANFLGVSVDFLLDNEQKNKPTAERSELIDKILTICDGLPEGKQTELLEYAKYLVAKDK